MLALLKTYFVGPKVNERQWARVVTRKQWGLLSEVINERPLNNLKLNIGGIGDEDDDYGSGGSNNFFGVTRWASVKWSGERVFNKKNYRGQGRAVCIGCDGRGLWNYFQLSASALKKLSIRGLLLCLDVERLRKDGLSGWHKTKLHCAHLGHHHSPSLSHTWL